jgi:hypothetical protein
MAKRQGRATIVVKRMLLADPRRQDGPTEQVP